MNQKRGGSVGRLILAVFFGVSCIKTEAWAGVELQPHRAYYTVSLEGRPGPQSSVTDVQGSMLIELNKICGGWTVQECSDMRLYHDDGFVEHVRWGYVTFEAEDSSLFRFSTYRKVDGDLVQNIRGHALREAGKVYVTYQQPHPKKLTLKEDIFFPTQHVHHLLAAADKGEKVFSRQIFDGSNEGGASEINTFIGSKKVLAGTPWGNTAHQLSNQPFWPVRFAVYGGQEKSTYSPLYSTTQDLLPNGIIKQYVIDYGGIKLHGVLERLELIEEEGP